MKCSFRSFDESKKSEKSIASMIVKNKEGEQQGGSKKEQKKKTVKIAERAEEPQVLKRQRDVISRDFLLLNSSSFKQEVEPEEDLDEQIRMENLKKLSMGKGRGGKSSKSPNMKSPKTGKGKKSETKWDPVLYGGKVNKEEAKMLDRTVGKPEDHEQQDNQLNQFVPDLNVVGKSSTLGQVDYESDDEEEEVGPAVKSSKSGGMFSMFSSLVRF